MNVKRPVSVLTVFIIMSFSASGALFTEGFEDGNMDNYYITEGVNSYGAATDQVYEGTYSGRVLNNGDFSTVRKDLGSTYKPDNVRVAIRVQGEASNMHGFFRLVDSTNDKTQLEIWTDDGTSLGATSGSEISIDGNVIRSSSSGNTWYYIELLGIDWSSGTISEIKVDGTQEVTDVSLTASNISSIELHTNQAGSGDYVWWDSIEFANSNAVPQIQEKTFTPGVWTGSNSVDLSVNVTDQDGLDDISAVTAEVYESGSSINSVQLSETGTSGIYDSTGLFTVDQGDVFYNVSVTVNDSTGAQYKEWTNKSLVSTSLSWTDSSNNEDGFNIYTNLTGGSFDKVADTGSDTTSFNYLTSALNFGDSRCFQLTSYNQYGESSPAEGCVNP